MLVFYCAEADELSSIRRRGVPEGAALWPSLEAAQRRHDGPVLAIRWEDVSERERLKPAWEHKKKGKAARGPAVPAAAVENMQPYCTPEPVVAAGGYVLQKGVLRPGLAEVSTEALAEIPLLLIFKRSVWDLPKGKQDAEETARQCALREVREETGLGEVELLGALGPTLHGYRREAGDQARYFVKTTHWFLMATPETDLAPERREGIEKAAWVGWAEAGRRLGYDTLRCHHRRAGASVRAILGEADRSR